MEGVSEQKRGVGRPTRYNRAITRKIVGWIAKGCTKDDAARAAGIHASTLYDWQRKYSAFAEAITRAEDALKRKLVARIVKSALQGDWRAAGWLLERKWREEWGRTVRHERRDPAKPTPATVRIEEELAVDARRLAACSPAEFHALIEGGGLNTGEQEGMSDSQAS